MLHHNLVRYCHFTSYRVWNTDRFAVIAFCILIAFAIASAATAFANYREARQICIQNDNMGRIAQAESGHKVSPSRPAIALGAFHSDELLNTLNAAATALSLPVNEIVFRLDENPVRPYLRYSATVKLFGGYLVVRQFVEAVRKPMPDTTLDAISCTRTDIRSTHVNCELTLSAFYARNTPHA